jgi:hypothetical protein
VAAPAIVVLANCPCGEFAMPADELAWWVSATHVRCGELRLVPASADVVAAGPYGRGA